MRVDESFLRQLDWNLLYTFFVVAEERSITRAANRLGLTQPAISNAMTRLEMQLNKKLLDRKQSKFTLTKTGMLFQSECREIYGTVSRLQVAMRDVRDEVTGHIKLALLTHVDCQLLDDAIADFHKKHPEATFEIFVATSADIAELVQQKIATLGVCFEIDGNKNLRSHVLYREKFALFCGKNHRLFGKTELKFQDLLNETIVTFPTDNPTGPLKAFSQMRTTHNLHGNLTGTSAHLEEVHRMIKASLGVGPLPIHVVHNSIRNKDLWMLDIPDSTVELDVQFISNPKVRFNRAEEMFIKTLETATARVPLNERTYPVDLLDENQSNLAL
ncbi:MAG: LysR family transcriptional regulator [Rhizobiaceae bacterium]|nr:LysR family transcriptional regulator [Rhizobiaceae bacterium]